jgi:hypothetical protein
MTTTKIKKNKLVACFGIKYEPQWLVDELIQNLSPFVDDFAILDDRDRTHELWRNEAEYRQVLRQKAFDLNADWILWTSPDERWCNNAKIVIPPLLHTEKDIVYVFKLYEMYTPTQYRSDGIWDRKQRPRLYRLKEGQNVGTNPIQTRSYPLEYSRVPIQNVGIYHLKHIEEQNRINRADVFQALDPNNDYQKIGYDYLKNDEGIELKKIPRLYQPMYEKSYIFDPPKHLYR